MKEPNRLQQSTPISEFPPSCFVCEITIRRSVLKLSTSFKYCIYTPFSTKNVLKEASLFVCLLAINKYLHDDFNVIILGNNIPTVLAENSFLVSEEPVRFNQAREMELVLATSYHTRYRGTWLLAVFTVLSPAKQIIKKMED